MHESSKSSCRIWRYELPGEIPALKDLNDEIRKLPEFHLLGEKSRYGLELAIEEIVSNTIKYGYDAGAEHHIIVELVFCRGKADVRLTDDGRPFNPLATTGKSVADGDLDTLPIGGVGLFLTREFVDDMRYRYENGMNILEFSVGGK